MPDRNGLEVAKEIQAINSHQRIIFVSALIEEWFDSIKEKESSGVFTETCVEQEAD